MKWSLLSDQVGVSYSVQQLLTNNYLYSVKEENNKTDFILFISMLANGDSVTILTGA